MADSMSLPPNSSRNQSHSSALRGRSRATSGVEASASARKPAARHHRSASGSSARSKTTPERAVAMPSFNLAALTLTNSRSRRAQAKVFQHQLVMVQGQKHEDDQPLRPKSKSSLRAVMVATAALS